MFCRKHLPLAYVLDGHTQPPRPTRKTMLRRAMRRYGPTPRFYRIILRSTPTPESILGPYDLPTRTDSTKEA